MEHSRAIMILNFLFFIIIISCQSNKGIDDDESFSDTSQNAYSIDFSYRGEHFFDTIGEVEIIPLEETKGSLLSDIFDIKFKGSFFYLTSWKRKHIYKFTREGEFINVLDRYGDGPDEYAFIGNIDFSGDTILVLDSNRQRMTFWNDDFSFLESRKIGFHARFFRKTDSGFLFDNAYQLINDSIMANGVFTDETFEPLKTSVPFEKVYNSGPSTNQFQKVNGLYNFRPSYQNILYKLSDRGMVVDQVTFDFGEYWYFNEPRTLEQVRNIYSRQDLLNQEVIAFLKIFEYEGAFLTAATLVPSYRKVLTYINKVDGKSLNFELNIDEFPQNNLKLLDVDSDGVLTMLLGRDQLAYLLESVSIENLKILGDKSIEDLTNMENPVILRCRLDIELD